MHSDKFPGVLGLLVWGPHFENSCLPCVVQPPRAAQWDHHELSFTPPGWAFPAISVAMHSSITIPQLAAHTVSMIEAPGRS